MSRAIKFRAWDRIKQRMVYQSRLAHFSDLYLSLEGGFRMAGVAGAHVDGQPAFLLMQFTGLLDKNGKEIYEGDVLNYGTYTGFGEAIGNPCNHVVRWDSESAAFVTDALDVTDDLDGVGLDTSGEVIGNIYETPGLLPANTQQRMTEDK